MRFLERNNSRTPHPLPRSPINRTPRFHIFRNHRFFLLPPLRRTAASPLVDSAASTHRRTALSAGVDSVGRSKQERSKQGVEEALLRGGDSVRCPSPHFASFAGPRSSRLRRRGKSCAPIPPHPDPPPHMRLKLIRLPLLQCPPHLDPQPHLGSQSRVLHRDTGFHASRPPSPAW